MFGMAPRKLCACFVQYRELFSQRKEKELSSKENYSSSVISK